MHDLKEKYMRYKIDNPHLQAGDIAGAVLINEIVSFRLKPGDELPLNEIAEAMGTSITPVREALRSLANLKLVTINENKRATVSGYNDKIMKDMQRFRTCLELIAAEQVCERATEEELDILESMVSKNVELFESFAGELDTEAYNRLTTGDLRFHHKMVESTHNPLLIDQYENIFPYITFCRQFFSPFDMQPVDFADSHIHLITAIKSRNVQFAQSAVRLHFAMLNSAKRL